MKENIKKPVLVLNKGWVAIRVKTVQDAIKLVFRERALFVEVDDYEVYNWEKWVLLPIKEQNKIIQTTKNCIRRPEIIVLTNYNKIPSYNVKLTRKNLFIRDNFTCQYTGKKVDFNDADIDHVIPLSKGGKNTWNNLVVASKKINRKKGNKTNGEAGLKLLKKPVKPRYRELMIDPRMKIPESWKNFIKK